MDSFTQLGAVRSTLSHIVVAVRTFKFAITYQYDPRVKKLDYFFFILGPIGHELPAKNWDNLCDNMWLPNWARLNNFTQSERNFQSDKVFSKKHKKVELMLIGNDVSIHIMYKSLKHKKNWVWRFFLDE